MTQQQAQPPRSTTSTNKTTTSPKTREKARTRTNRTSRSRSGKPGKNATGSPRWARITRRVLVYAGIPLLFVISLYIGLYIGYVRIGEQPASEIWQWSTWKHVFDLVFADG